MRKNYVKTSAVMAAMIFALTGCGAAIPDMTQEEEQMVGEYAAMLLLQYNANNRSRLVSREEVEAEELKQAELEEKKRTEEVASQAQEEEEAAETEQQTIVNAIGNPEEFFELPDGIVISYIGYEVCDSYPQDDESSTYFALDATEGKRLVVLKFNMENQSQTEQHIDILSQNAVMRVLVNGSYSRNVLTTMLMDDMSTYVDDIPAGDTVELVLLAELDHDVAESISTLMLSLKNETKTCTIQLK